MGSPGRPLPREQGEDELVAPRALEEDVLDVVSLLAEAEAAEESVRRLVERVGHGVDAVDLAFRQQPIEHAADGFAGDAAALLGRREGEAELDLARIGQEVEGQIAEQRVGLEIGDGDLKPGVGDRERALALPLPEAQAVFPAEALLALVAGHLGVGPVGRERRDVALLEGAKSQPRGDEGEGLEARHHHSRLTSARWNAMDQRATQRATMRGSSART